QGRLLEAESEARKAVLGALAKSGRDAPHTAWMLRSLVWVLREQGRYRESERLGRAVVDIYQTTRTASVSLRFAVARTDVALARAHAARGESLRAVHEFRAAIPSLLARGAEADDEATRPRAADQRLAVVLSAYIGLLADIGGTAVEREAGIDAAAEAFALADL